MPRPILATIHSAALRHNMALARRRAGGARVWAVVKANAYGHGLERAMRAFASADGFALVEIDAAVRLREMGWSKEILLLEGFFDAEDLPVLATHRIQTIVHCDEQIAMLEHATLAAPLDVHLKINTGMNRLGFRPHVIEEKHIHLSRLPNVRSVGFVTHFANADNADNPDMPQEEQVARFNRASEAQPGMCSMANSASLLNRADLGADWVRAGIMLYGATPGGGTAFDYGLEPAMSLTSEIIAVQQIEAGDAVGYGSRFVASGPMRIGVVACGYADGYPRHAPDGTPIWVEGKRTCLIGRVSMDMLTVDLTDVPEAKVGSPVELWGRYVPIDVVAEAASTIGYELMCAVAPRVPVVEDDSLTPTHAMKEWHG